MTTSFPSFGIHYNSSIHTVHIFPICNKYFPPKIFYIISKFYPVWTIIPSTSKSTINLRTLKDKTPSFTKRDYLFHFVIFFYHYKNIAQVLKLGTFYWVTLSSPIL